MNWMLCVLLVCVGVPSFGLGCDIETREILEKFNILEKEIDILKQENNALKRDNGGFKHDINMLKYDTGVLKRENEILKQQVLEMTEFDERNQAKLDALQDKVTDERLHAALQWPKSNSKQKRLLESGVPEFTSHKIAFSAALTHDITLGNLQTVLYDKVLTNIGNAYDTTDGHFTVPTKGLYLLSVTVSNQEGQRHFVELVKHGIQIGAVYLDSDDYNMATQTVVVLLEMNDKIWVRRYFSQDYLTLYGRPNETYNTFSGVLLYEM